MGPSNGPVPSKPGVRASEYANDMSKIERERRAAGDEFGLIIKPPPAKQIQAIHPSLIPGRPFGSSAWLARTAKRLNLTHTIRPEGHPPKTKKKAKRQ